jgi:rSAM/selenodomain-associated transferase 1
MSKNLLIIFTRNPELGKVKTRLAKTIGNENALTIYKTLLVRTAKTVRKVNCDKAVYYSVKIRDNDIWDASIFQKYLQQGEDLGVRMLNAFKDAFNANYNKVVIIGSDLYNLTPRHINEAFERLHKHDIIIGPAHDGGYYLLGMKSLYSQVFKNKDWGTSSVFKDTLNDLQDQSIQFLETLNDIDVYDDLKNIEVFKKYL